MKNVICIDLTKFNEEKLIEISKLVGLEYNTLLEKKKKMALLNYSSMRQLVKLLPLLQNLTKKK